MSDLSWATVDPSNLSAANPGTVLNLVGGQWQQTKNVLDVVDPMNGEVFMKVADTKSDELPAFVESLNKCPKSGLHNPLKNPARYRMLASVCHKSAALLREEKVADYFAKLVVRTAPKSYGQALGEVIITRQFLENWGGDQIRFLARGFSVAGDHYGQESRGYRWPFGKVAVITPFNFPVEIPVLQVMGALFMGNKPVLKGDSKNSVCIEQFLRMLHHCGLPLEDIDLIHCDGPTMNELLLTAHPRNTLFTGSSRVAEKLAVDLHGKIKVEDAGFDWKILGPDCTDVDYVAHVIDKDAFDATGQKCSAQSILFIHEAWQEAKILDKVAALTSQRNLDDLTVGPVLTVTTQRMVDHVAALTKIPGARVVFGGKPLTGHKIPDCYGAFEPTCVHVPIDEILKEENFALVTTEIFGPFFITTDYKADELHKVLECCERMENHLTAAVVSNDSAFQQEVLANTLNGTTYTGIRARTTGAPQNHWFGPAGDPRGAGIGSPEAILVTWSCHREIIHDHGPVDAGWTTPKRC